MEESDEGLKLFLWRTGKTVDQGRAGGLPGSSNGPAEATGTEVTVATICPDVDFFFSSHLDIGMKKVQLVQS